MSAEQPDLASYVDPFAGTAPGGPDFGHGGGAENTFPGADVPFGMVQWSPDTAHQQPGGYHYPDNRIKGFSLTHFSGAGCDHGQDIPFMPYVGGVTTSPAADPDRYMAHFSHDDEVAEPGYYAVTLGSGVTVELTVTQRSGMGRITYPGTAAATLLINVSGSVRGVADAEVEIGERSVSGWARSGDFCGGGNAYRVYFAAVFDRPFAKIGTWHDDVVDADAAAVRSGPVAPGSGLGSGAFVTFDTRAEPTVTVRVGVSYVSVGSAAANAEAELGTKNFPMVRDAARAEWNARLGQIRISGGTPEQRTIFYTELYHCLLHPNVFSDTDGRYIGFDGQVHQTEPGHVQYANFSGWDIYRSQMQLIALLLPRHAADIAQSMLNQAQQAGDVWDRWSVNNDFAGVMTGDPYHSIIASVYAFGATEFDAVGALASMVRGATTVQPGTARYVERPGLAGYQALGYVPDDPSTTLEYTIADFGIAMLAQRLGDGATYREFIRRAQYWQHLFNPANGYLQPRHRDGSFATPFDPASATGYVEGNGAQYTWTVPHNVRGLTNAMGGDDEVICRLDTFFTELNAGPHQPYAYLGNEPSLNVPWLYVYAGAPYRTQEIVRRALTTLWRPDAAGFVGNNDLGAMSSWYVWGALGLYPQVPGRAELVIGSPLFEHVVVERATGQTITIDAPGATATPYVQSLEVDAVPSTKPWLSESFLDTGGTLAFRLAPEPVPAWGADPIEAPPSFADGAAPCCAAVAPGQLRTTPGGPAATVDLVVAAVVGEPVRLGWRAEPPADITITPADGTIDLPAFGTASTAITVAAGPAAAEGFHQVHIALDARDATAESTTPPPTAAISVRVARPATVLWYADNTGVSDDTATAEASLDRGGYSYSAQALAAAGVIPGGRIDAGRFTFTWPADPVGRPDNIVAVGGDQTLHPPAAPAAPGTVTAVALLGCATNGNASGDLTVRYTDGSTDTTHIGFGDWVTGGPDEHGPAFGNVVAARMPYRNARGGRQPGTTYLFATAPITLRRGKRLASLTLPGTVTGGDLHVFAVAVA